MKRFALMLSLVMATAVVVSAIAADEPMKKPLAVLRDLTKPKEPKTEEDLWMHAKLQASQEIFAGLTHGDLDTVKHRARRMLANNVLENWLRKNEFTRKSAYQGQMNAFEFANKELIRNAEDGDIDGTLEAYVRLSRSCVECHKLIREPAKK